MKKYIVAISLGIIALGFNSCRRDSVTPADVKEELLQRTVVFTAAGEDYTVKSTDGGFENGDVIGIFAPDMEKYNVRATVSGSKLLPERPIRWEKDQSESSEFFAYYPYGAEVDASTHTFSIAADQTTAEAFMASDLRTAHVRAAPMSTVAFVLKHRFSKIDFLFTGLSGGETITGVVLKDLFTQATVDLGTGGPGGGAEKADISAHKISETKFAAVLIPQTYLKTEVTTSKGRVLKYTTYIPFVLESGYAYRAELVVPEAGHDTSEINISFTVVGWDDGETIPYGEPVNQDGL